jgi:SPP1 family predicted phage head-tail adaptor
MLQTRIRRGELDRQIYLIKPVIVDDAANAGSISNWVLVDEYPQVFARKKELPGKELVVADRLTYVQMTIWTMVYRTDLTTRNRIVYNQRPYEITSIIESDARGMYIDIHATLLDTETWAPPAGEFNDEEFNEEFAIGE